MKSLIIPSIYLFFSSIVASLFQFFPAISAFPNSGNKVISESDHQLQFSFLGQTQLNLVNKFQAANLLRQSDPFTQQMSEFDLMARLKSKEALSEADYLQQIGKYTKNWSKKELQQMEQIIKEAEHLIAQKGINLHLPDQINIIKTNGKDEGGAAYTRSNNIILNKKHLSTKTFIHELFHVYSRYNPDLKNQLYSILGFEKCASISLPADLQKQIITNPDVVKNQHFIRINSLAKDKKYLMITYSKKSYDGGNFFDYLNKGLLLLEGDDTSCKAALDQDGNPIILNYADIPELERYIGKNTAYNIHPEEISADHFAFIFLSGQNYPNQQLINAMLEKIIQYEQDR